MSDQEMQVLKPASTDANASGGGGSTATEPVACAIPTGKRQKTPHAVVAFDTTSDAMAMEAAAKAHGDIPGRVIPVPREITAGCGLAWAAPCCQSGQIEAALASYNLAHEGIYIVDLY